MFTFLKTRKDHSGRFHQNTSPQIFDLLQLSKKERDCRAQFLQAKHELHKWNGRYEGEENSTLKISMRGEGIFLRREAENAVLFYRLVRRERIRMFHEYMDRLPVQKDSFCKPA